MKDGQIRSILRLSLDIHAWRKAPAAHKGMVHVAKIMAATAVPAFADATLIPRVKADLAARTQGSPYVCPIPADVGPPLDMAAD
jgi:aminobenzoyl-glutamate utilization protein B